MSEAGRPTCPRCEPLAAAVRLLQIDLKLQHEQSAVRYARLVTMEKALINLRDHAVLSGDDDWKAYINEVLA